MTPAAKAFVVALGILGAALFMIAFSYAQSFDNGRYLPVHRDSGRVEILDTRTGDLRGLDGKTRDIMKDYELE